MKTIATFGAVLLLAACGNDSSTDAETGGASTATESSSIESSGVRTKDVEGFGGVIAKKFEDSQEWWAPEELPQEGSPNVIIFLLDDVGFAQVGSFGALIETPNIDALAANV